MDDVMVERFLADGFVKVEGAFPPRVAEDCARLLWRETGYDPDDPGSWREPVVWVGDMAQAPFAASVNSPALHKAFDLLVGAGRWQPRYSLGSFPLRFPHPVEPDDAGWHIEGSYVPENPENPENTESAEGTVSEWPYANLRSRGRALLMLMLYTEVTAENAPTRVRVGSHLDVPRVLEPFGERGASALTLGPLVAEASAGRPVGYATGRPGDVYLCHPFLVHAAQPHHGDRPRFMAQPPLFPAVPYELERSDGEYSAVEFAIRRGLSREDWPRRTASALYSGG
ncbi:phytanoyl-CoA dioxygenase family protein [Streptomyces sp. NPDC005423]|uniref:phytanoyl-CoA dioxygenase family protein n=1 Tax=Streptomyces sp. NPDC005423 TaxID=3155343 RepID=UPI0033B2E6A7